MREFFLALFPHLTFLNGYKCSWLRINDTDPEQSLAWLVEQLLDAEKAGDKVRTLRREAVSDAHSSFA